MNKTCERCCDLYEKSGKGSTASKYCDPCKTIVREEQVAEATKKSEERKAVINGNVIPDEDQLFFYGYKEPLRKFDKGFGYYGVVAYSKEKDMVQCHFCGKMYKNVGSHAALKHNISKEEYKDTVQLQQNTALVGEGTRTKLIVAHKDVSSFSLQGKSAKAVSAHMKKMSSRGVKHGKNSKRTSWALERRNKNGNCPDQLIDRIQRLADKLGERPSAKQYAEEYGSFQSIITVYGSWENAIKKAEMVSYSEEKSAASNPEYLLEQLRDFYKKYGRTPRTSDMKRGLVPYHQMYWKVFGSLNNARILAGIPVVIPVSKYRYEEVTLDDPRYIKKIQKDVDIIQHNYSQ